MNVPADSKVCTISTLDSAGMSQLILRFLAKAFSDSVGMLQLILRFWLLQSENMKRCLSYSIGFTSAIFSAVRCVISHSARRSEDQHEPCHEPCHESCHEPAAIVSLGRVRPLVSGEELFSELSPCFGQLLIEQLAKALRYKRHG